MQKIEKLFDESRDLHRAIEKVITFGVDQEDRLKNEIREYIVTPHMETEFEDLLTKMQLAMDKGGPNEVGVWISGFYGSGKSSFAKYLGLALDDAVTVDGQPFIKHLQDRFKKKTTKQLLATTAQKFPAAVVFLDLASDMLAGSTMEEISTVLFYKVLEYAGYSRNLKVAALERRIQKDGRFDEFLEIVKNDHGFDWEDIQNDRLVVDSVVPEIAHDMYPKLFKTPSSFSTETGEIVQFETDRVKEMLDIVRGHSGKEYIMFIVDEVGQYVASSSNLILNLDGLAKNLKSIGNGKVWIMGTAQQTLTEDDPRAALNTPELFKLNDRFPIKIDLPASDIKQICYERLLKKSEAGKSLLTDRFTEKGQELRQNTRLENAEYYSADFDSDTFADLYPFLPSHFEILLQLLGQLAKSTGGIGLRSAIKVIQDILIEGPEDQDPICEKPVGWLATMVTLFDALEKDIERASKTIYSAYGKIAIQRPGSQIHADIGKTVAVLQILDNIPVTRRNVAALMHSSVEASSNFDAVEKAIEDLINEPKVPFDERDGNLCFLSERLSDIQQTRSEIHLPTVQGRRIFNTAIKNLFEPLPSRKLFDTLTVTSGVKARSGQLQASLSGDKNAIQTIIEFVPADDFDTKQTSLVDESRGNSARNNIYMLGRNSEEFDKLVLEIYRCEEIARRFKNDPDDDVRSYCSSQHDRATELSQKLEGKLRKSLLEGVFIFRADKTAVDSMGSQLLDACKKFLGDEVAEHVFEHYKQAPVRVDTAVAESFLKTENLSSITEKKDPLGLVKKEGGSFEIDVNHAALGSIRDYLGTHGNLDGKQLVKKFSDDPYGWSQDTLRYLIAAMFRASELKLKISGIEITALGQQAIEGLRNNNSFKKVIVGLRDNPPDMERLARAAERLTELTGQQVLPLEQDICKAAARYFASIQNEYGSLAQQLQHLELPGSDELQSTCSLIASSMQNDCSDAVDQVGAADSAIYSGLAQAAKVRQAFDHGIGSTITDLKKVISSIDSLPDSGIPGQLRAETAEQIEQLKSRLNSEDFFQHATDYSTAMTELTAAIGESAKALEEEQKSSVRSAKESLQNLPEWEELTNEEQTETLGQLDDRLINVEPSIAGLKQLVNNEYSLSNQSNQTKTSVVELGRNRVAERIKQEQEKNKKDGNEKLEDSITVKKTVTSYDDFKTIRDILQVAEQKAKAYAKFSIEIRVEDDQ
ncbi:MAG: BREX system P-loop protein BrxC [Planctomycetota bacterium]